MKTQFILLAALLTGRNLLAADAATLRFGGERIGVPPLSLAESLAQRSATPGPPKFGAKIPQFANGTDEAPRSPALLPRTTPDLKRLEESRPEPRYRVSRSSGIPVLEPNESIDYKMTIIPPNPAIDFKMTIIELRSPEGESEAK